MSQRHRAAQDLLAAHTQLEVYFEKTPPHLLQSTCCRHHPALPATRAMVIAALCLLRSAKSTAAAKAAGAINPEFQIRALQNRVSPDSEVRCFYFYFYLNSLFLFLFLFLFFCCKAKLMFVRSHTQELRYLCGPKMHARTPLRTFSRGSDSGNGVRCGLSGCLPWLTVAATACIRGCRPPLRGSCPPRLLCCTSSSVL